MSHFIMAEDTGLEPARLLHLTRFPGELLSHSVNPPYCLSIFVYIVFQSAVYQGRVSTSLVCKFPGFFARVLQVYYTSLVRKFPGFFARVLQLYFPSLGLQSPLGPAQLRRSFVSFSGSSPVSYIFILRRSVYKAHLAPLSHVVRKFPGFFARVFQLYFPLLTFFAPSHQHLRVYHTSPR